MLRLLVLITDEQGVNQKVSYTKTDTTQMRLNQIQTYVVCNLQRNIQLEKLAAHIGMNRSSLCTFIKQHTGMTFTEYLNLFRIRLACRLLVEKERPIKEISYEVGYNDVSYFNRMFNKLKGCSPREFRNTAKT